MSVKKFLRDFIINQYFPTFLAGVVTVIKLSLISIPNMYWGIALTVFLCWTVFRFWLGYRLKVIEEYKSWMIPLGILTKKPSIIWIVIMSETNYNKLPPCWFYYFRCATNDLGKRFDDLETELDKLSNPYLLSENRINSITQKIIEFIIDYGDMYTIFIDEMINTNNICLQNSCRYSIINEANNGIKKALNESKNTKIKDEFKKIKVNPINLFLPKPKQ